MRRKIIFYYLPWLLVLAAIFYFSSLPELVIVAESAWDIILRKLAHIFVFFLVFITTYRLLKKEQIKNPFVYSFIFTILYAISDEYHQTFITGRVGAVSDVFIDSLGGLLACFFLSYYGAFRDFIS